MYHQARAEGAGKNGVAAGFAIGVFITNTPLWGLHSLLCVLTARMLKLHPLPMLTGSLIGLPPVGPALIIAAISLGSFLMHGRWLHIADLELTPHSPAKMFKVFREIALEWTLGSLIVGAAAALLGFAIVRLILMAVPNEAPKPPPPPNSDRLESTSGC